MSFFKHIENFEFVSKVNKTENHDVKFTHSVNRLRKKAPHQENNPFRQKFQNIWYAKRCRDFQEAFLELLAQELLRLFNPHQPKTRIAVAKNGDVYILSKEIPGFTPLTLKGAQLKKSVETRHHKGLGVILVLVLLINEIDLKNGNIGQDKDFNITKIDGDNCFANLARRIIGTFSPADIDQLPFIQDYYSYNWFDIISGGVKSSTSQYFLKGFEKIPALRQEINETILAVLLLNEANFKQFVNFYVDAYPELADVLSAQLLSTRQSLLRASINNESFKQFFHSLDHNVYIQSLASRFENFTNISKQKIFRNAGLEKTMHEELVKLTPMVLPLTITQTTVKGPKGRKISKPQVSSELSITSIYRKCKSTNKKQLAKYFNISEYKLTKFLKDQHNITYTALKKMSQQAFEQRFLKPGIINAAETTESEQFKLPKLTNHNLVKPTAYQPPKTNTPFIKTEYGKPSTRTQTILQDPPTDPLVTTNNWSEWPTKLFNFFDFFKSNPQPMREPPKTQTLESSVKPIEHLNTRLTKPMFTLFKQSNQPPIEPKPDQNTKAYRR